MIGAKKMLIKAGAAVNDGAMLNALSRDQSPNFDHTRGVSNIAS